jgi:hypothetical protein
MYGDVAAIQVLVQHGADVNGSPGSPWQSDRSMKRPLPVAAAQGRVAAVDWLLQQGITADGSGLGPALELAGHIEDPALIRMLLSYGPTQAVIPRRGPTALVNAVRNGHVAVAEELLKAGVPTTAQAIQHARGLDSEKDVRALLRRLLRRVEAYEQSPAILQAAIQHGQVEFAQLLRKARAAASRHSGQDSSSSSSQDDTSGNLDTGSSDPSYQRTHLTST